MGRDHDPGPPRWAASLLRSVLTPGLSSDGILGDLHEEFLERAERSLTLARVWYATERLRASSVESWRSAAKSAGVVGGVVASAANRASGARWRLHVALAATIVVRAASSGIPFRAWSVRGNYPRRARTASTAGDVCGIDGDNRVEPGRGEWPRRRMGGTR